MTGLRLELDEATAAELVEQIAERAAAIVLERLDACPPESEFLSVLEAAELLRCDRQRVYDLCSDGRLTRFKDGSRTLVSRLEIAAHLAGEPVERRGPRVARHNGRRHG